ncbi:hypothetical protein ACJIZ3_022651 [Penstemon smallii]|uniref:K Homology domain-containing protein n=1 Tax=Penstemon smallii TaxID=265156 RepID=A0ABD3TP09_9LAMI
MDRSRSKRYYHDQDYESETLHPRNKPRYGPNYHHRRNSGGGGGGGGRKMLEPSPMVTTSYRILCHDIIAGGVIGKSGSIIKAIRQHTGAWINVHELIPGDEVRIIEISDTRRRDPDGRIPAFSPAQEALFLINDRILETEGNVGFGEDENDYGSRGNKVVAKLVVSQMHVGSLLGKGGKIIEQMRMETKTHIRILPRDHTLPRCVGMSEEIVQVVGDMNAVKNAMAIISSRLRESQHRDRSHLHNPSPDRFFPNDDFHGNNNTTRRSSAEGISFGSRSSTGSRSNNYSSRSSGYAMESGPAPVTENDQSFNGEGLVFRILCPAEKVINVVGGSDGIVDLLQNEIGVNVDVADPVAGSDEHTIIISSDEGPDDELFPAQEALLHIQTRIVDLVPEQENIITTRLLLHPDEIGCLGLKDGSFELGKISGADIVVLPRKELPVGVSGADEIVQIVGEIKAAREVLMEVTSRIRSHIYRELSEKDLAPSPVKGATKPEASSKTVKQTGSEQSNNQPSRISVPLVTRSILEVVIPPHAVSTLVTKSRKLNLISELSGASVKLIEDRPEVTEKIIQISGTPEQAERAQSLLQGFILSTEEDGA